MASVSSVSPTFYGHIASTQDALLLFEACLSDGLNHVARRPLDRERAGLTESGNVFIYEEHSSGIKRWTDGVPWSPSRILGNFLVYRELERPFPPGEKKRAMKRSKPSPGISKQKQYGSASSGMSSGYGAVSVAASSSSAFESPGSGSLSKETERSLIGSLVDSYGFKEEGLVKKTVRVTMGGVSHHLVSYYTIADVMNNKFGTPSKDPGFQHITPRPDLTTKQNFRTPIDAVESLDRTDERSVYASYPYNRNGYEMTYQSINHRSISFPTSPISYAPPMAIYNNYATSPSSGSYDMLPEGHSKFVGRFTQGPGMYQAPPKPESYDLSGYRQQQRYDSAIGINADPLRAQIPPVTTKFERCPSNYEQSSSVVSGLYGISSSSAESNVLPFDSKLAPGVCSPRPLTSITLAGTTQKTVRYR